MLNVHKNIVICDDFICFLLVIVCVLCLYGLSDTLACQERYFMLYKVY